MASMQKYVIQMIVWWCVYRENNRITFEPNTKLSIPYPNATNINQGKKTHAKQWIRGDCGMRLWGRQLKIIMTINYSICIIIPLHSYIKQQQSATPMILRCLTKNNPLLSHLRMFPPCFAFATGQSLLNITKKLVNIPTLELDQLCVDTLDQYKRDLNPQKKSKSGEGDADKNIATQNESKSSVQDIMFLYNTVSDAQVGFLKGDIHADFIYKLNKYLETKSPQQLLSEVTVDQMKRLLKMVSEMKDFRLPKKGIKNSTLEDKKNMQERQILLQIVSNDLSTQRYENVLDSLTKLEKIHLTGAFREYYVEWFTPLCAALHEEQNKCKNPKELKGSRKIYAQDFLKLAPERLTLLCLSELLRHITSILFKDFTREPNNENSQQKFLAFDSYDSIRYKNLCLALAKWVSVQTQYEYDQNRFKMVMKLYDEVTQKRKQHKNILQAKQKQLISKQRAKPAEGEQKESFDKEQEHIKLQLLSIHEEEKKMNEIYKAKLKQIQEKYNQKYIPFEDRKKFLLQHGNKLLTQSYKYKSDMDEEVQFQIGATLIYLMKEILKIQNKSGFKVPLLTLQHKYLKRGSEIIYDKRLKINDHFLNTVLPILEKEGDLFMHLDSSIPTMIPPMPWIQYEIGGYFQYPSTFMRFSNCKVQERLVRYSDLSRVFNVLNELGKTPWKINKKVLDVVDALWVEGGNVGQIPKRYSQLITTYTTKLKEETSQAKKKQILKKIQELRDEHSLRSDFNLKLNLARSFSKLDRFFYPHNVDFRGRVYPIPPHFNHIGNDLSRGLLLFADGKRLGKSGFKWLKIHCANLMGKDKNTVADKLSFMEANLGVVEAIASDPLKNRQWLHNEDCWQSLAAIFQLNDAIKSNDPQNFVSCLHIHQDGSCNGLQHYAALGRDTQGAYQVNLGPTQRPGDVYTHVANMVIKAMNMDIQNKNSKQHALACKLKGHIKRKTIKQTVMTSVYGVTFIGARQQIARQLKDQKCLQNDDQQFAASIYLAQLTLQAISSLFSSAHQIKKWLIQCARVVSDEGNPMGWITPMGLPIVQPYRKQSNLDMVNSIVQILKLSKKSESLPINKGKQKSAFPPNFVHSLDSTHMMYTAEKCVEEGITFAAVHDSYWAHAANIDRMNEILREQFIRLHSEPLLESLKYSLELRYPHLKFPDIPQRGDFNLEKIKESVYFFS